MPAIVELSSLAPEKLVRIMRKALKLWQMTFLKPQELIYKATYFSQAFGEPDDMCFYECRVAKARWGSVRMSEQLRISITPYRADKHKQFVGQ